MLFQISKTSGTCLAVMHLFPSQLFRGRPGGRRHVRSGGRFSDTLMWSWRATCPNTEMRRRDRRWDSEVRPVRWSTSLFQTRSYHRIPSSCLRHFWWKASRVLTSADSKVQMSAAFSNTDKTSVWYVRSLVSSVRRLSLHIRFRDVMTAHVRPIRRVRSVILQFCFFRILQGSVITLTTLGGWNLHFDVCHSFLNQEAKQQ